MLLTGRNMTKPKHPQNARAPTKAPPQTQYSPLVYILVALVFVVAAFFLYSNTNTTTAPLKNFKITIPSSNKTYNPLFFDIICNKSSVPRCSSPKCGRAILDDFVTVSEADLLRNMIQKVVANGGGGGDGGPTIFDLSTGAITYKDKFINLFSVFEELRASNGQQYIGLWTQNENEVFLASLS